MPKAFILVFCYSIIISFNAVAGAKLLNINAKAQVKYAFTQKDLVSKEIILDLAVLNIARRRLEIPVNAKIVIKYGENTVRSDLPGWIIKRREEDLLRSELNKLAQDGSIAKENSLDDYFKKHPNLLLSLRYVQAQKILLHEGEMLHFRIIVLSPAVHEIIYKIKNKDLLLRYNTKEWISGARVLDTPPHYEFSEFVIQRDHPIEISLVETTVDNKQQFIYGQTMLSEDRIRYINNDMPAYGETHDLRSKTEHRDLPSKSTDPPTKTADLHAKTAQQHSGSAGGDFENKSSPDAGIAPKTGAADVE